MAPSLCAVSHEYAQLQKQLVAAHEDQAVSAALLHRLVAGGATAAGEDSSQEGDGGVPEVGERRRSALDPLRSSQVCRTIKPFGSTSNSWSSSSSC